MHHCINTVDIGVFRQLLDASFMLDASFLRKENDYDICFDLLFNDQIIIF